MSSLESALLQLWTLSPKFKNKNVSIFFQEWLTAFLLVWMHWDGHWTNFLFKMTCWCKWFLTPPILFRVSSHGVPTHNSQHLPSAFEDATFSKAATEHTTQSDCVSHLTCFSFQQDELKWEAANEYPYQTNFHSTKPEKVTFERNLLESWKERPEGGLLKWLISTCPCLCLPKEDGAGTGCRQSRGGLSSQQEQQSWQLCFSAPNTLGKATLGQPCCHLWSFYSTQVIYRNLFVQSQYLPVWAVKIYNSSVPLACCFPVNNGNFHHQEERLGVAMRATLCPSR